MHNSSASVHKQFIRAQARQKVALRREETVRGTKIAYVEEQVKRKDHGLKRKDGESLALKHKTQAQTKNCRQRTASPGNLTHKTQVRNDRG